MVCEGSRFPDAMNPFRLDFIGIGAAKAATTWIARCLAEHPAICVSDPKELNFFGRRHVWPPSGSRYYRGRDWLAAHFRRCRPGQVKGEYGVSYLIDSESPSIIKREMPDARLIVSLRNPPDALHSLYFHLRKQYVVPDTFEGLLDRYPDFVAYGDYHRHLSRFFSEFARQRVHVVLFDDVQREPASVMRGLFGYLGVDPSFQPPSLHVRTNELGEPRILWLRDAVGGARDFLRTAPGVTPVRETLRAAGVERLANWVERRNWRPMVQRPPMKEETRAYLRKRYAEGNRALGDLLGRDLSHWD